VVAGDLSADSCRQIAASQATVHFLPRINIFVCAVVAWFSVDADSQLIRSLAPLASRGGRGGSPYLLRG